MLPTPTYRFDENKRFLIENYEAARPFSSFLPGIAGPMGVPMWAFYTNRGQAIASFGVESKDSPILEFQPANRAYQQTQLVGFRTFLKIERNDQWTDYEPFGAMASWTAGHAAPSIQRHMSIGMNDLQLSEHNHALELRTDVRYFTQPGESFAGLVRRVTLTNTGDSDLVLEILDGAPVLIPYGVDNTGLKAISRTLEAWMEVVNVENRLPFYRLKASAADSAEVAAVVAGHFALGFVEPSAAEITATLLPVVADPHVIFGQNTSLRTADRFAESGLEPVLASRQINTGKTPCAFFGTSAALAPGQSVTLSSLFGHSASLKQIGADHARLLRRGYLDAKHQAAQQLAETITQPIYTQTGHDVFDAYCRQTFLDNVLRGGWPLLFERHPQDTTPHAPHVYHIYSRKHGDPERDYNAFFLAAEYFSQGNGNYRDVNQNRRMESFFQPGVGAFNVRVFLSLIQADGYNPLVVQGTTFTLEADDRARLAALAHQPDDLADLLVDRFTPGGLLQQVELRGIGLRVDAIDFLEKVMAAATQHVEAEFGEGYWVDHWTYNLDLIESYLAIFPENEADLLFGGPELPFFESPATVRPRRHKYVLADGEPRQFNAVFDDEEKMALIDSRRDRPNWVRSQNGHGAIYTTTVIGKLILLAVLKTATLDPSGMGVEMEAGKPGWYDALNGLPGLFGSSMSESYELDRLFTFLHGALARHPHRSVALPVELSDLLSHLVTERHTSLFERWNAHSHARENYRSKVRFGFQGDDVVIDSPRLSDWLQILQKQVRQGIQRAEAFPQSDAGDVPPTYFVHTPTEYRVRLGTENEPLRDDQGRPLIEVHGFTPSALPLFLEGPARALKSVAQSASGAHRARAIYDGVKQSGLFDAHLGMYKVNTSLADQPHHIGRARAFTPGWLENESIWLHMEYKYLLALLKAGLYDEFFTDFRTALIPFQDPAVYGRSPLENSSFIVSSAHPDDALHGAGFVARLSGSTAEFLEIWALMMAGKEPFSYHDGEITLSFQPLLPGWLFDEMQQVCFTFLGHTRVTYHNPQKRNTYSPDARVERVELHTGDELVRIEGGKLPDRWARQVRTGAVQQIHVYWG